MARILVVDDEPDICGVIELFLTKAGYEVWTASNGEEALRKVGEHLPSLVLLDIKMPGIDGIETLRRIKERDKGTAVIMMTAVSDESVGRQAMGLGAADYIIKPIDLKYLKDSVLLFAAPT